MGGNSSITELRRLLAERVRQSADRAVELKGEVPAADIQNLETLSKLCSLAAPPPRPDHRPIAVGVAVVSLAVLSAMLFIRADATPVELEASVTSARFRLMEPAQSQSAQVTSVSVKGAAISDPDGVLSPDAADALLEAVPGLGSITIQRIEIPKDAIVTLERDSASAMQFDLAGPGAVLQVSLHGRLRVSGRTVELKVSRAISFTAGDSPVDVSFRFPADAEIELLRQASIDTLSMFEVDADRARKVSAIRSGAIFFEALNGQARKFREAEHIQFGGVKGRLRTVRFAKGEIALRYDGEVSGLTTGVENPRPLMPTWLDLARSNQPLLLLWGTAGYVIGVLFAFLKWLDFKV